MKTNYRNNTPSNKVDKVHIKHLHIINAMTC